MSKWWRHLGNAYEVNADVVFAGKTIVIALEVVVSR